MKPKAIVAIAGGTGSGKTTIATKIIEQLPEHVTLLPYDAYYRDNSHLGFTERTGLNYDHPDSFDTDLYERHLVALRAGETIERPVYNFNTHLREPYTIATEPREIILAEGILVLWSENLRRHYDLRIFVDTDADVRILRRISRDMEERGRTLASVISQYLGTVKPMHDAFVEPTKRYADVILPEGGHNLAGFDVILARLQAFARWGG